MSQSIIIIFIDKTELFIAKEFIAIPDEAETI